MAAIMLQTLRSVQPFLPHDSECNREIQTCRSLHAMCVVVETQLSVISYSLNLRICFMQLSRTSDRIPMSAFVRIVNFEYVLFKLSSVMPSAMARPMPHFQRAVGLLNRSLDRDDTASHRLILDSPYKSIDSTHLAALIGLDLSAALDAISHHNLLLMVNPLKGEMSTGYTLLSRSSLRF